MSHTVPAENKSQALTVLSLRDPSRFVPGETYAILIGGKQQQRFVNVMCSKPGEIELSVFAIRELNRPEITFAGKDIKFPNPIFHRKHRAPKRLVLPRYTQEELLEGVEGVTLEDPDKFLLG